MPPCGRHFSLNLFVEQCGLIIFYFLEDGAHKGFADETAAIRDSVPFAETIQCPLLTLVEQNGNSMFAGRLAHLDF